MADRVKILRGAECCKYEPSQNGCPEECPYLPEGHLTCGLDPLLDDVIVLIRKQETVATNTNVLGKWISVKDAMPARRHAVLVYTPHHKNIWAASMHEDGNWYIWTPDGRALLDPDWNGPITHWMPLPEPPAE